MSKTGSIMSLEYSILLLHVVRHKLWNQFHNAQMFAKIVTQILLYDPNHRFSIFLLQNDLYIMLKFFELIQMFSHFTLIKYIQLYT